MIAVVAILIAVAVPVIQKSRAQANHAGVLSKVQQCSATLLSFAESNGQRFPVVMPLDAASGSMIEIRTPEAKLTTHYFAQITMWNVAIEALGGGFVEGVQRVERSPAVSWARSPSDFLLGQAFMTEPGYWEPGATQTRAMWRAAGLSEVQFPAQKAMLHDPAESAAGSAIAFVDGHAETRPLEDSTVGVRNSLDNNLNRPLVTTRGGVRGRDYE